MQLQRTELIAGLSERDSVMLAKGRYEAFSKKAIRSDFFRELVQHNRPHRHLVRFFINSLMFTMLIYAQYYLWHESRILAIAVYPVYLFVQALIVSGFVIHAHEFTHRHIKMRWLNDLVGVATGLVALVNFYSFQHAHQLHHVNIGNLDTPEAGAPVSLKGQKKIRNGDRTRNWAKALADRQPFLWLFLAWPLFVFDGDYNSWIMPFSNNGRVNRRSVGAFIAIFLMHLCAIALFPAPYLFLYLPAALLGGNRFIVITYLHHAHDGSLFFNEHHHNFYNVIMANTDRDFGAIVNFFMMNNGFHIAHHLNPQIAYHDLKKASEYLRSILPSDLTYPYFPNGSLYRDLKNGKYEQRNAADHEFFRLKIPSERSTAAFMQRGEP